jgi:hypothetical protein
MNELYRYQNAQYKHKKLKNKDVYLLSFLASALHDD